MALTVRLNPKTERMLNALARRRGLSRSDVVREAVARYEAGEGSGDAAGRPYAAWLDVIGVVSLGVRSPARTTGEQFTAILSTTGRDAACSLTPARPGRRRRFSIVPA